MLSTLMTASRSSGAPRFGLALWGMEPAACPAAHAQLTEELGFDSIRVIDAQLLCREVYITLAAIAPATKSIRSGPGVTQPATRRAIVTAGAMATLHERSGGRVADGAILLQGVSPEFVARGLTRDVLPHVSRSS